MKYLLLTGDVAEHYKISNRRVRKIASTRNIGTKVGGRLLFTKQDVKALKPGKIGYPRGKPRHSKVIIAMGTYSFEDNGTWVEVDYDPISFGNTEEFAEISST